MTHGAKFEPAAMVELEWLAPNVSVGDLVFTATVLKDFEHFWVNHSVVLKSAQPAAASAVEPPMPVKYVLCYYSKWTAKHFSLIWRHK